MTEPPANIPDAGGSENLIDVVRPIEQVSYNTGSSFFTNVKYKVRDDLINWCRAEAAKVGFTIVIQKSDNGSERRKQYFILGCERGGVYKETKKELKKKDTATRKCECPFRLRGYFLASQEWSLSVVCGDHNHKLDEKLEGHILAGRLRTEDKLFVHEMTRNLVQPKNILSTLKDRDSSNKTGIKQVYNAIQRYKQTVRGENNEMQHLLKCLEDHKYFYKSRTVGSGSTTVQDIFWAHPESVKLFNTFPTVLLMDSTYKTNRYKMPLFEIVGATSTQKSYSVGFAFIANEKEDNFVWALTTCKNLLKCGDSFPKVIVTDRDTSLMNAVARVFPSSAALLCTFHIFKNVNAKLKKVSNLEGQELTDLLATLECTWKNIVDSSSEEMYAEAVVQFRKEFENYPSFVKYVEETVLGSMKEKFVRAWTNRVMHIGNTTTNRVECQHGVLKSYLLNSKGDLVRGWEGMDRMLTVQHTGIQETFGRSNTSVEHHFKNHFLYKNLIYNISRECLRFIRGEEERSKKCGRNRRLCGCAIKITYGLPCACLIALKIERKLPIRLDEINSHWKRLRFEGDVVNKDGKEDVTCISEWNGIQERLKVVDYSMQLQIRQQMRQLAWPQTTTLTSPNVIAKSQGVNKRKITRGESSTTRSPSYWEHVDAEIPDSQASQSKPSHPKRKTARIGRLTPKPIPRPTNPLMHHIPMFMRSHIEDIIDVQGDGNCGFRAAAVYLGKGEESHVLVRRAMIRELNQYRSEYLEIFATERRLQYINDGLYPPESGEYAPVDKWLTFPDMGHILATTYNKVVVELARPEVGFSETFFPLRGRPPSDPFSRIMSLVLTPNHFFLVKLKDGCPLPPTCKEWKIHRSTEAETWEDKFLDRQVEFNELMAVEMGDMGPHRTNEDDPISLSGDEA